MKTILPSRALLILAAASCGGDAPPAAAPADSVAQAPAPAVRPPAPDPLDGEAAERRARAIEDAVRYLVDHPSERVGDLLFLGIFHRRFGREEFADTLERYDAVAAAMPRRAPDVVTGRRLLDGGTRVRRKVLDAVVNEINQLTHPALFCTVFPLRKEWRAKVVDAIEADDYHLTHVGLAIAWAEEQGCTLPFRPGLRARVVAGIADLMQPADGLADLEIEAATFLWILGEGELVPRELFEVLLDLQLEDGGWPTGPDTLEQGSHLHTTSLALWLLLETATPADEKGPLVAPAR